MFTKSYKEKGKDRHREVQLMAEVKTLSPFGHASDKPWEALFALANAHGDIISIHTDKRWGGSMDLIRQARKMTERPILAKGIHSSDDLIREAHQAGADLILVVGRVPNFHGSMTIVSSRSGPTERTIIFAPVSFSM